MPTGRAVVHLEAITWSWEDDSGNSVSQPFLQMRVLEVWGATQRPDGGRYVIDAEPGELLMRKGEPWYFDPDGTPVMDWVRAQLPSEDSSQSP